MPTQALDPHATEQPNFLSARLVFVYGTLRKGELRDINLLRPAPLWVGEGSVAGALYDLGAYPGIVLRDEAGERIEALGEVHGEIYAITPDLEQILDEIEEVWPQQTGEYTKREVEVSLLDGSAPVDAAAWTEYFRHEANQKSKQRLVCLLYEIALQRTEGKPLIQGGDWVAHRLQV